MALTMKALVVAIGVLASAWPAASVVVRQGRVTAIQAQEAQKGVAQVVKMLQGMLDTSRKEAKSERELYAKYKCYCDENEKEKTEAIETATKTIALLESEIEELLGSNSELSQEVAKLKAEMDKNEQARDEADELRKTEKETFEKEEKDLDAAVGQLGKAIEALAAIGGDQELASKADEKFMADFKEGKEGDKEKTLISVSTSLKQALVAAQAVITPSQRATVDAFLQRAKAPFTEAYEAQSGEIVGILKSMKETFASNLEEAREAEKAGIKAHDEFIKTKKKEHATMKEAHDEKADEMGSNDDDLSTKKPLLADEIKQKESDIEFLGKLTDQCEDKAKEYKQREAYRTSEDAAISEAVALLNSDEAFGAFGKVEASGGSASFLQVSGSSSADQQTRSTARQLLQDAAHKQRSTRLASVARLLLLGNPFTKVLDEITKMEKVIEAEGKQDQETLDWCNDERTTSDKDVKTKESDIETLEGDIDKLKERISHPETGLEKLIEDKENEIEESREAQAEQTKVRRTENQEFQKEVENCQVAAAILEKAVAILEKYYEELEKSKEEELGLVQKKEDPEPPKTWEGEFKGQSEKGGDVVEMLKTVLKNTVKEEETAHEAEMKAQGEYEDSMSTLKETENEATDALADAKKELSEKKLELDEKRVDLENTEKEKLAIERYLEEIKPGCDFITKNFDDREANRGKEEAALKKARTLIKKTPAFAAAEAKAKEDSQGKCKETCKKEGDDHAECQACLKDVSVPGYCASNAGAPGC